MSKYKLTFLISSAAILIPILMGIIFYFFVALYYAKFTSRDIIIPMAAMSGCSPDLKKDTPFNRFYVSAQHFYELHVSTSKKTFDGSSPIAEVFLGIDLYKECNDSILHMAKIYKERGADINGKTSEGVSAIFPAIAESNITALDFLIDNGFDICVSRTSSKGKPYLPIEISYKSSSKSPAKKAFHDHFLLAHKRLCANKSFKVDGVPPPP